MFLPCFLICWSLHSIFSPLNGKIIVSGAGEFVNETYRENCLTETCSTAPFAISANASNSINFFHYTAYVDM